MLKMQIFLDVDVQGPNPQKRFRFHFKLDAAVYGVMIFVQV